MSLRLLFLGTGTSAGVPMIGCKCAVCTSADVRDRRSRASVMVSYDDSGAGAGAGGGGGAPAARQFLIDTTPELRAQCLAHDIMRIDGVFYTHAHADHVFGLDDLRRFNAVMDQPVDLYAEPSVIERFRMMFTYIFESHKNINPSFIPQLRPAPIDPGRPLERFGSVWTPLRLMHGRLPVLGFRVDASGSSLAYCTDVSSIPPATYPLMEGLDVLVIDALRYRHHPTHFTVDQALQQIDHIQPKRAFLTHIAHEIMHAELDPKLPENVKLAYDGLEVECG